MDPSGVTFTLQWRKYGNVNCRKNVTKIGLWDPDTSKLDWRSFKTYVCQNLGVVEDVDLSYIDSGEEDLPIESEQEFREALKLARRRARSGRETVLKVHQKRSTGSNMPHNVVPGHVKSVVSTFLSSTAKPSKQQIEATFKSISRKNSSNSVGTISNQEKMISKGQKISFITDKFEPKNKEHTDVLMSLLDKLQKLNLDPASTPPSWFHSYMRKFKGEIIAEVTTNFLQEVQQAMRSQTDYNEARNSHSCNVHKNAYRQRVLTQILSGGEITNDCNELKLLKEIQKLRKREKKLERKFDFKLRKLEHKTKKIIEKRSKDRMPYRRLVSLQRSGELEFSSYLMDAVLLNDCKEVIVSPGEHFTKVWEVKNTGNLSWTDKTDLRQVWGSHGLEPENSVTEVPPLQPGEVGTILMEFRAPDLPGLCNSYWHFHHKGERFGHWLACSVLVKESTGTPHTSLHEIECPMTRKNIHCGMIANFCSEDAIDISKHDMKKCLKESSPSLNERLKGNVEPEASKVLHFLGPGTKNSEMVNDSSFAFRIRSTQQICKTEETIFKSLLKESKALDNIRYDGGDKNKYSGENYKKIEFDSATHVEWKNRNNSYENNNTAVKIKKNEFDSRMFVESKQKDASHKNNSSVENSKKSEVDKTHPYPMTIMNSYEKNNHCENTKKNEFDRTHADSKHHDNSYENKRSDEKPIKSEFDSRTHVDSKYHNSFYENNNSDEKSKKNEFDRSHAESKHRDNSYENKSSSEKSKKSEYDRTHGQSKHHNDSENVESVEISKKSEFDSTTHANLKHHNNSFGNNNTDEKYKNGEFDSTMHANLKLHNNYCGNNNTDEKSKNGEFDSTMHANLKHHNNYCGNNNTDGKSKNSEFDSTMHANLKHHNNYCGNNNTDEKSKKSEFDRTHTDQNYNFGEKSKKCGFHSRSHSESKHHGDSYEDIRREKVYVVDPSGRCFAYKLQNAFSSNTCSVEDPCGSCFAFSYAQHPGSDGSRISVQNNSRMNGRHRTHCSTCRERRRSKSPTKSRGNSTCKHVKSENTSSSMYGAKHVPSSTLSSKTDVLLNNTTYYRDRRHYPWSSANLPCPYRSDDENFLSDDSYTDVKDGTRAPNARPTNHNMSLIDVMKLPARMASGAACVASTAIEAARSVVNTCKESLQERCQRSPERRTDVSDHLDLLEKMGFKDSLINFQLLHKHHNDLNKVLSVLLSLSDHD